MARARLVLATVVLAGALAGACGTSPPVDMYFGTDVGADFRAPVTDASGGDTNVTTDAGVDAPVASGAGGVAGSSSDAGSAGAGGATGSAGAGGSEP